VAGCSVILVEERIASPDAVRAALRRLRPEGPRRVVLATPQASAESLAALDGQVDAVFCLMRVKQAAANETCCAACAAVHAARGDTGMDRRTPRREPLHMATKKSKTSEEETRRRELENLLDEIGSGAVDDLADLTDAQLTLLRAHLTEEEVEKLFDRTAGPERD
jgi:hypothetical protein